MPTANLYTYEDAIYHASDFMGGDPSLQNYRAARRGVLEAYNRLCALRDWSYYTALGRINTVASYSTGTVAYDHTGGTYERQLTLTSGTWPTWISYGVVLISNIIYQVATRESGTVITLSVNSNPGADVASGTSYTAFQDSYVLPVDFLSMDRLENMSNNYPPVYVKPSHWLALQTLTISPACPRYYTIAGDPNYHGAMAIRFYPAPDQIYRMDFMYHRRPRQLQVDYYKTGTVTTAGGNATVTGSGTSWNSTHVGSVIRIVDNNTQDVTGKYGANPFEVERVVTAVASATSLTVDTAINTAYNARKYVISDPIDIDEGAMRNAFLRMIEEEMALFKKDKALARIRESRQLAVLEAAAADARSTAPERAGPISSSPWRLAWFPSAADIE